MTKVPDNDPHSYQISSTLPDADDDFDDEGDVEVDVRVVVAPSVSTFLQNSAESRYTPQVAQSSHNTT